MLHRKGSLGVGNHLYSCQTSESLEPFTSIVFLPSYRHAGVAPSMGSTLFPHSFLFCKKIFIAKLSTPVLSCTLPSSSISSSQVPLFFFITVKKTDSVFSYMEQKFLKLLKKVYKSKATWTKFWWGQFKLWGEFVLLLICSFGSFIHFINRSWLPQIWDCKRVYKMQFEVRS